MMKKKVTKKIVKKVVKSAKGGSQPEAGGPRAYASGGKGGKTCLKILLAVIAVLFFFFLLIAGAVALAIAATGLVEVPILSNLIKLSAICSLRINHFNFLLNLNYFFQGLLCSSLKPYLQTNTLSEFHQLLYFHDHQQR